jgi:pyruvate,water dikinase
MNLTEAVKGLFSHWCSPRPPLPFSVLFKKFKSILDRNNHILELMADMGDKLGGDYVFDRQYITDVCEKISDSVFKLISDLSILSQTDNVGLFLSFERIQHAINEELAGRPAFPATRTTIPLGKMGDEQEDEAGGKFARLGTMKNVLGLPTPNGFVITTKAFYDFMDHNHLLDLVQDDSDKWETITGAEFEKACAEMRSRILRARFPKSMWSKIQAMIDSMAGKNRDIEMRFAIRSSAWGEDTGISFAGQYESVLNVPRQSIFEAYKEVIASAYTPEALRYRTNRGYRNSEMAMAVICQNMIEAEVSGAMYTYAPLPMEVEAIVVNGVWGLGPAVVQGIAESDTFILDRVPPHKTLSVETAVKANMIVAGTESGTEWKAVQENLQNVPCLTPERLERLAEAGMAIERYYKRPQDVEWAFDRNGELWILQSRGLNVKPRLSLAQPKIEQATRSAEVIFSGLGKVVQRGVASGRVYVSKSVDDLKDFSFGDILVAQHTSPKYSRVMRKANGIITDVGSHTGHMATIAREYRVPTIVDTGIATKVLKTGDEITLDASHNAVYRGRVRELSNFELTEQEIFEETYEYRLMKRLLNRISPLNLTDNHSSDFKPERCRTYHDITRYVHQKAVDRLIDLSENFQKYHDKVPKRLEFDIPLGILVVDAEGGTEAPTQARIVTLEQIKSVPFKAFLEGLRESGMWSTNPAPVDLGSFMSSVTKTFSASMTAPEKLGRNLAVISKEYMNLNLRLGYHFSLIDSYICDTMNDNYIYFRFLGGVTDFMRRSRRAKFIAAVLEQFDFRVDVHGDIVVGGLKKNSRERMYGKMKVLGGLIGYTRQLDVSMDSEAQVAGFHSDFMRRILPLLEVKDVNGIGTD